MKQTKKEGKKAKDSSPAPAPGPADPLSAAQDPLSLPPTSDPLSAALLDPLSQAAAEATGQSFGGRLEKVRNRCESLVEAFCKLVRFINCAVYFVNS